MVTSTPWNLLRLRLSRQLSLLGLRSKSEAGQPRAPPSLPENEVLGHELEPSYLTKVMAHVPWPWLYLIKTGLRDFLKPLIINLGFPPPFQQGWEAFHRRFQHTIFRFSFPVFPLGLGGFLSINPSVFLLSSPWVRRFSPSHSLTFQLFLSVPSGARKSSTPMMIRFPSPVSTGLEGFSSIDFSVFPPQG